MYMYHCFIMKFRLRITNSYGIVLGGNLTENQKARNLTRVKLS